MRSDLMCALAGVMILGLGCGADLPPLDVEPDAGAEPPREPVRLLDPVALRPVEAARDLRVDLLPR